MIAFIKKYWKIIVGGIAAILGILLFTNSDSTKVEEAIKENELDTERIKGKKDVVKSEIKKTKAKVETAEEISNRSREAVKNQTKRDMKVVEAKAKVKRYTRKK